MAATKELVSLGPDAVELVDNTILTLSREMPQFAATMAEVVKGDPNCLLLVEFSGDDAKDLQARLDALDAMMTSAGLPRCRGPDHRSAPGKAGSGACGRRGSTSSCR